MSPARILAVDDDALTVKLLGKVLSLEGYEIATAASGAEALEQLAAATVDAAVIDIRMPGMSGLELLREIKRRDATVEVVMTTAHPDVATAVEALKEGASDYLQKPLNLDELRTRVRRVVERRALAGEVRKLRRRLGDRLPGRPLVGGSPAMARVKDLVERVAQNASAVLIEGESGTGKEIVAATIHQLSTRADNPFIPVNCGAIPADLLESELFGHVRGAFTGAVSDTLGLFRSADGGTIFLDEIGELPLALQTKLLRVLQEKEVRPVGTTKTFPIDARVIAATNRDLEAAVREGRFRSDLYYRLNVVRIVTPPLRERRTDIPALVSHFLRQLDERYRRTVQGVSPDAMALLVAHDFPGNVRELENLLERAYALGAVGEITPADIGLSPRGGARPADAPETVVPASPDGASSTLPTLAEMERDLILRALQLHGGSRELAAHAIGLSPRTMYRRLKEYGLQ